MEGETPLEAKRRSFLAMLISIVITLIVIGLLLWLIQQLPLDPTIMMIIRVVIIVFAIIWLLQFLPGGPRLI